MPFPPSRSAHPPRIRAALAGLLCVGLVAACGAKEEALVDCTATHPHRDCSKGKEPRCQCDSRGLLRRAEVAWKEPGRVDLVRVFEYDDAGRLVEERSDGQTAGKDRRPDGAWDYIVRYTVGEAGRAGVAYDTNGDGTFDRTCTYDPPCQPDPRGQPCPDARCD